MTRGKGIYDDESGSAADKAKDIETDPDRDTPDFDKDGDEPTA